MKKANENKSKELLKKKHLYAISFIMCICFFILLCCDNFYQRSVLPRFLYTLTKTQQDNWIIGTMNGGLLGEKDYRWKKHTTDYFLRNVKAAEKVVEVGTSNGYYTNLFAKLVGEKGKVFAYEINDKARELTKLSLKMNDLYGVVDLKPLAIADKNGFIDIVRPADKNRSCWNFICGTSKKCHSPYNIEIPCVALDDELKNETNGIDWMKINAWGFEGLAIKGAKKVIEGSPNLKIVMRWSTKRMIKHTNISNLIDELHSYGFKFYRIPNTTNILGRELSKEELMTTEMTDLLLVRDKKN